MGAGQAGAGKERGYLLPSPLPCHAMPHGGLGTTLNLWVRSRPSRGATWGSAEQKDNSKPSPAPPERTLRVLQLNPGVLLPPIGAQVAFCVLGLLSLALVWACSRDLGGVGELS